MNHASPFYVFVGFGVSVIIALLTNGCVSPARAERAPEVVIGETMVEHFGDITVVSDAKYIYPD